MWNKLFRKSFWDMHGLVFPEGIVWEDLHLITRAHVLARAVDIITDPIYFWRERGAGALSITQSRTDISNYTDRINVLLFIDAFLRSHKPASMVREHQRKALDNDVWLYVGELGRTSPRFNAEFMRLTRAYLAQVDKRVFRRAAVRPPAGLLPDPARPAGRAARVRHVDHQPADQDRPGGQGARAAVGRPAVPLR